MMTPATPQAADSVGVAHPSMIMPTTRKTMKPIGSTSLTTSIIFSFNGASTTSYAGAEPGSRRILRTI